MGRWRPKQSQVETITNANAQLRNPLEDFNNVIDECRMNFGPHF